MSHLVLPGPQGAHRIRKERLPGDLPFRQVGLPEHDRHIPFETRGPGGPGQIHRAERTGLLQHRLHASDACPHPEDDAGQPGSLRALLQVHAHSRCRGPQQGLPGADPADRQRLPGQRAVHRVRAGHRRTSVRPALLRCRPDGRRHRVRLAFHDHHLGALLVASGREPVTGFRPAPGRQRDPADGFHASRRHPLSPYRA
jgi:hypothetical protein